MEAQRRSGLGTRAPRKRRVLIHLLPWLLAVALCSGTAGAGEIVENPDYQGERKTIRYGMWGGANETAMARVMCEAFVKKYPEYRIDVAVYPWGQYWAKLQTQTASGLAPDVFWLYTGAFGVWCDRGALYPLSDLIEKDGLDLEAYEPVAVDMCTWEGTMFCMPMEMSARVICYSKDRLEESGIPKEEWPTPDKALTWDEFKALAHRLTLRNDDGTFAQYGMGAGYQWTYRICRLNGTGMVDRQINPTRPTVLGNDALLESYIENFHVQYGDRCIIGEVPLGAAANMSFDHLLVSDRYAMCLTGAWALPVFEEAGVRFGLTPIPETPFPAQLIDVNSMAIYSGSRQPEDAWKFVSFMASDEVQPLFGKLLRGVPVLRSAQVGLVENDFGIDDCEAFLHDLPTASPNLNSANSYVIEAIDDWKESTEGMLDAEYDKRLRVYQKDGVVTDDEYTAFVADMTAYVETLITERFPDLDADLHRAFERAIRPSPTLLVRVVAPALIVLMLGGFVGYYLFWVRRSREPEKLTGRRTTNLAGYLFIGPWLLGFFCFVLGPILSSIYLSFTEWNMIDAPRWLGVANYLDLRNDEYFWIGLRTTLKYAVLVIPISLVGGLFTAGLLTANIRGTDVYKAVIYMPSLFTGAAAAVLWINMFNKEFGVINHVLSFVGIAPVSWLDEWHAFYTVVLMNVFWVGGAMIIYYAGMKQIPKSLFEAADIDGAGPVRKFWSVTIPMLSPVILFMVVITTIGAFQIFTPALFFASDSTQIGAPVNALRFYSVNIYSEAFNNLRMGNACCHAIILFVIIFIITMVQMRLSRRFVHTEGGR